MKRQREAREILVNRKRENDKKNCKEKKRSRER